MLRAWFFPSPRMQLCNYAIRICALVLNNYEADEELSRDSKMRLNEGVRLFKETT
jgi:hypothetical protein